MADPLSISVSVLTLSQVSLSTAKSLYTLIKEWQHAPQELLQLSNEISDLNLVLSYMERICSEAENPAADQSSAVRPDLSQSLKTVIGQARYQIDKLDSLLKTMTNHTWNNRPIETRKLNWILNKNKVKRIMNGVKSAKMNMHMMMTSLGT